jgi:transporter family-2 protein
MFYLLALCNGIIGALSRLVNASLATYAGSLRGSWINHIVGTGVAGAVLLLGVRTGTLQWGGLAWYYWIGGCMGVFVVAASNYAVPRIGAVLLGMLLLAAQLVTSAALDHWGALGGQPIELSWARVIGLLILLAGAALTMSERNRRHDRGWGSEE